MVLLAYNLLFPLVFLLYLPVLIVKLVRRGGYDGSYWQRFGLFSSAARARLHALDRPVWIHACSVGETVAALTFIRRWLERDPAASIVLSTTTTTGHAKALNGCPEGVEVVYCPLDFYPFVRWTLNAVRPAMLVIFEVEIWPNLILQTVAHGAKMVLVNGRMSDKSSRGYARHRWLFARLFGAFDALCVQSEADCERVARVVGDDVQIDVCNTMKFDQVPDGEGADKSGVLDEVFGTAPRIVFLAGSTHAGEEALATDAFVRVRREFPALRLVLVPRHHERTPEVVSMLRERELSCRLAAGGGQEEAPEGEADVLLINTTGELMDYYAAADIVFVGSTLAGNEGGHNIIEPAIFGKPVMHGVNMQNFRDVARIFREGAAAVELADDAALERELMRLMQDSETRGALGVRARRVVEEQRGAIDRTLDRVLPILKKKF